MALRSRQTDNRTIAMRKAATLIEDIALQTPAEYFSMIEKVHKIIHLVFLVSIPPFAQYSADPQLLSEINKIKAVDNHAHPLRYVAEGGKPDDEYDALPLEAIDPFPLPLRLSPENREFIDAWKHFYS